MSKIVWTDPTTLKDYLLEPSPLYEEISSLGYVPTTTSSGTGSAVFTTPIGKLPVNYTPRQKIITDLIEEGYWVKATGSRVTKDGWTDESDWDYVVYDPENTLHSKLSKDVNWRVGGSGNGVLGVDFQSYKQGQTNLIVVCKDSTWKKYIIATNLLRMMNPKTKKERCAIFDSVFEADVNSRAVEF